MKLRHRLNSLVNLKQWFLSQERPAHKRLAQNQEGFTLTELLIVVVIAGLIVSALMSLVVELIGTEQRESLRTETQRSMQLALNYMAADLRQAVYIYNDNAHPIENASQPSYMNFLPVEFTTQGYRPVLAFWKPRSIDVEEVSNDGALPEYDQCAATFGGNNALQERLQRECFNLWKQRRAYSLVVYLQVPNNVGNPNGKWTGQSRIERYELFKFDNLRAGNATDVFDRTPGFVDPAELGSDSFATWPYSGTDNCQDMACVDSVPSPGGPPSLADSRPAVLVDFVDDPDSLPANRPNEPQSCDDLGADPDDYDRVPTLGGAKSSNSFFICLRDTAGAVGLAQDVVVYLRGNARALNGSGKDSFLPTLQTRVTMRGIIDKNLNPTTAPVP